MRLLTNGTKPTFLRLAAKRGDGRSCFHGGVELLCVAVFVFWCGSLSGQDLSKELFTPVSTENLFRTAAHEGIAPPQPSSSLLMSEQQAIAIAKRNSRQLQISVSDIDKRHASANAVKTALLPNLQTFASGLYPLQNNNSLGISSTGLVLALPIDVTAEQDFTGQFFASLSQPIGGLYVRIQALKSARLYEQIGSTSAKQTELQLVRDVKQSYHRLLLAQSRHDGELVEVKAYERSVFEAKNRLDQQAIVTSEYLALVAQLKQHQYAELQARHEIELQREQVNLTLSRDLTTDFTAEEQNVPNLEELDRAAAHRSAQERRPELQSARLLTEQAKTSVKIAKGAYLPDLDAQVGYVGFLNYNFISCTPAASPAPPLPPKIAGYAAVIFHWEPFDWGRRRNLVQEARITEHQSELSAADTEQRILLEVDRDFDQLGEARLQLDARSADLDAAQRRLQELQAALDQKAALLSDLMQQQAAYAQAQSGYQQALTSLWAARADFEYAIGEQ